MNKISFIKKIPLITNFNSLRKSLQILSINNQYVFKQKNAGRVINDRMMFVQAMGVNKVGYMFSNSNGRESDKQKLKMEVKKPAQAQAQKQNNKQKDTQNNTDKLNQNKSDNSKPQQQQQNKQLDPTQQQMFNLYLGYDKNHSFKNDLIIAQQTYKKNIKQLRQAILFQDLLKKQIDIQIYDTNDKPYYHHILKCLLMMATVVGTFFSLRQSLKSNKKFKVIIEKTTQGRVFINTIKFMILLRHLRMSKRYVQKIIYHTQDQTFTFIRRKAYGARYQQKISRFKILYTQNQALNKRGTNYINIENHNQYKIGYQFAWKKEDLFSHLISQRIRT